MPRVSPRAQPHASLITQADERVDCARTRCTRNESIIQRPASLCYNEVASRFRAIKLASTNRLRELHDELVAAPQRHRHSSRQIGHPMDEIEGDVRSVYAVLLRQFPKFENGARGDAAGEHAIGSTAMKTSMEAGYPSEMMTALSFPEQSKVRVLDALGAVQKKLCSKLRIRRACVKMSRRKFLKTTEKCGDQNLFTEVIKIAVHMIKLRAWICSRNREKSIPGGASACATR
eukprot:6185865-Pleurochrysis_carterae.AAC.2